MQPHRLGVLHRDVAETSDARNGHPFAGSRLGLLQAFVGGDTCTQDRCQGSEVGSFR